VKTKNSATLAAGKFKQNPHLSAAEKITITIPQLLAAEKFKKIRNSRRLKNDNKITATSSS
jgi:hypothetical protein